jgi:prolyl-tRNA synthetase
MYDNEPIRVRIDDRDIRGGEKKWQWVKRGVPLRVEVGPRDIGEGKVMLARRDVAGKGQPTPRAELVAAASMMLTAIQGALYDTAKAAREAASVRIDSLKEFEAYFTPKNEERPEIHALIPSTAARKRTSVASVAPPSATLAPQARP